MNQRQRFLATLHYQPRDRSPICDFGFWPETIELWHEQGLPAQITYDNYNSQFTDPYFGMDQYQDGPWVHVDLLPRFESKVIEDRGDHELAQQGDGVTVLRKKTMGSIPEHHGHLLVDRESWKKHYKWRLDPNNPDRYPKDMADAVRQWNDPDSPLPHVAPGGSLYGRLRDWMGVENLSLVVYDDPAWFGEMVETVGDCIVGVLERAIAAGAKFDACGIWEDMCYSAGPLLSPTHFKQYLVPQYKRYTELLAKNGCDIIWVDCDGKIDDLLPLWLEAGVNCMFPIEVGTWNADPVQFRKQYGRELLMMGGVGKRILAGSKKGIEDEVRRLTPLAEEGGYIGFADHRVPPDVPLENYVHYLKCARRDWGKGINLKPMPAEELKFDHA